MMKNAFYFYVILKYTKFPINDFFSKSEQICSLLQFTADLVTLDKKNP